MVPPRPAEADTSDPDDAGGGRRRGLCVTAAVPLLAGVSAVMGCRAADTDGVTPVPQLLAFLPWLLLPAGLALLCAFRARWWAGTVWALALLGLLAWYIDPYGRVSEAKGTPVAEVRVLTSNVEFGHATGALVPEIRRLRPDVVFVEECEYGCQDTLERDFAAAYPYRQAVRAAGSEGSLLLSRYPLRGTGGVPGTMGMPGAVADVRGHAVRLQLAHPMPPLPRQVGLWRRELGRLREFAAAAPQTPTILAGDFNASQDHAAFRRILDTGLHDAARLAGHDRTASWPARTARFAGAQIDHVLVTPDFTVTEARFLPLAGTDHRALLTALTLRDPKN